jgi:serine/threonine protein kinase
MSDLVGKTIGRYRILARLGRGGLAEVYKAYQPGLDRYVSIKVLHSHFRDDDDLMRRFEREALIISRLRHPNIVPVYDFDREGDLYFMAMEYIDGPTLKDEMKARKSANQPFSLEEIARIFMALCSAIEYAHNRQMVHRDLKPSNVMINQEGQVVLTDFGIARVIGGTQHTPIGATVGTPAYMSPEQCQGQRGDERSDIYSLGVILYEMATGTVPYDAETPFAIVIKHISEPLPVPTEVNPNIPESVERVILKAMSKNPNDRYQTPLEMAEALREAVGLEPDDTLVKQPLQSMVPPPKVQPIEAAAPSLNREEKVAAAPASPAKEAVAPSIPRPGRESIFRRAVDFLQRAVQFGSSREEQSEKPAKTVGQPIAQREVIALAPRTVSNLRLDAAVPDRVSLGRTFDLAVAVRQLSSSILSEADLTQVRSGSVQVSWPESETYIQLRVQVSAPECKIYGTNTYSFRLYTGQDSPVFYFHLTPAKLGEISIIFIILENHYLW